MKLYNANEKLQICWKLIEYKCKLYSANGKVYNKMKINTIEITNEKYQLLQIIAIFDMAQKHVLCH